MKDKAGPRRLVSVQSLSSDEYCVMRMLEPDVMAKRPAPKTARGPREVQPFVIDTSETRTLHFGFEATQSTMYLNAPDALVTYYKRKMMAFLLFKPNPRHIVIVGLGGGSLAKFCYRHLARTHLTVVEISPEVIALREEFHVPADCARFRVVRDDGAAYVRNMPTAVDVLLVDAFDEGGIARAFADPDFYRNAAEKLTPNGVLVMNLSGDPTRYVSVIEGARAAFDDRLALVSVATSSNILLFVCKNGSPASPPRGAGARAAALERRLKLEFPRFLSKLQQSDII